MSRDTHRLVPLVVLMCLASGSTDALAITSLGSAFVTVITGNVVFIGVAIGSRHAAQAAACSAAILGYVAGTAVGSHLLVRARPSGAEAPWHRRVMIGIAVELAMFGGVAVAWVATSGDRPRAAEYSILVVAAAGMGLQSVAARQFPVAISTTYFTGALTALVEALAARRPLSTAEVTAAFGLVSLVSGAAIAIAILRLSAAAAIFVPLVALAATLFAVSRMRTLAPSAA